MAKMEISILDSDSQFCGAEEKRIRRKLMKRNYSGNCHSKKIIAVFMALALLMSGMYFQPAGNGQVKASGTEQEETAYVEAFELSSYKSYKEQGIAPKPVGAGYENWLFAGWFTDEACTDALVAEATEGSCYAKFVPAEVLSVKAQVTAGTTADTAEKVKLRIVSTVDSLLYSEVGFKIKAGKTEVKYTTNNVFRKIVAKEGNVAFDYEPAIFHEMSQYFITATIINISPASFSTGIQVTPYWKTLDGTEVDGAGRYARVEDSYRNTVNVPVRLYSDADVASGSLTVTYDADIFTYIGMDMGNVFDTVTVESTAVTGEIRCTVNESKRAEGLFANLRFELKDGTAVPDVNSLVNAFAISSESALDQNGKETGWNSSYVIYTSMLKTATEKAINQLLEGLPDKADFTVDGHLAYGEKVSLVEGWLTEQEQIDHTTYDVSCEYNETQDIGTITVTLDGTSGSKDVAFSYTAPESYELPAIIDTLHPTDDILVADVVASRAGGYEIDPTGVEDCTDALQQALYDCQENGGGTVYLPSGRYRVTDSIVLPAFVTLRGEYEDPDSLPEGEVPSYGAVILADVEPAQPGGTPDESLANCLFAMSGSGGVKGLTVYYPNQSLTDVQEYGFTFYVSGFRQSYMLSSLIDCTIINGYQGLGATVSQYDGSYIAHEMMEVDNLKGTFLKNACEMYNSADVGTMENVTVSPSYWAQAAGAFDTEAPTEEEIADYTTENTTALLLGDLEWSTFTGLNIDRCLTAVEITSGKRFYFSGAFYDLQAADCGTGLLVSDGLDPRWGLLLADSSINAATAINNKTGGLVKVAGTTLKGATSGNLMVDDVSLEDFPVSFDTTHATPNARLVVAELDNSGETDVSQALQTCLDSLKDEGGIVYLPGGYYRLDKPITVPAGVELLGVSDVAVRGQRMAYASSDGSSTIMQGTILVSHYGTGPVENTKSILDCDSNKKRSDGTPEVQSSRSFSVTTADNEYMEGTGAFKTTGSTGAVWYQAKLDTPVDLSEYKDGGISFWLYISDINSFKGDMYVELGSAGKADTNEYRWNKVSGLTSGWNEVTLKFSDVGTLFGTPDLTCINWFRIWVNGISYTGDITTILDDVRAVEGESGLIVSCDTRDGITVNTNHASFSVTTANGEYKQGSGAFKATGKGQVWYQVRLGTAAVDISEYAGGGISFWLYLKDYSNFKGTVSVEVGSGNTADAGEYQWDNVSGLKEGWNEVQLMFADARITNGPVNLKNINWFRIYAPSFSYSGDVTMILDDVHAIEGESGMILSGDGITGKTIQTTSGSIAVATGEDEHKQGTGAIKCVAGGTVWYQVILNTTAADVSAYKDGGISFWLYVSDPSKLSGTVVLELGSGGKSDTFEDQWTFDAGSLQQGWQRLYFDFATAKKSADGGADLSKINWFRIFGNLSGQVTFILDGIRAEQPLVTLGGDYSGISGIQILYPANSPTVSGEASADAVDRYVTTSYAIGGSGTGIYCTNCSIVAASHGIRFTDSSDFVINNLTAGCYANVIRLENCSNGIIDGVLQNGTTLSRNTWKKSLLTNWVDISNNNAFFKFTHEDLNAVVLEDCENVNLHDVFAYGAHDMVHISNSRNVYMVNLGADNMYGAMLTVKAGSQVCLANALRYNGTSLDIDSGSTGIRIVNRLTINNKTETTYQQK